MRATFSSSAFCTRSAAFRLHGRVPPLWILQTVPPMMAARLHRSPDCFDFAVAATRVIHEGAPPSRPP